MESEGSGLNEGLDWSEDQEDARIRTCSTGPEMIELATPATPPAMNSWAVTPKEGDRASVNEGRRSQLGLKREAFQGRRTVSKVGRPSVLGSKISLGRVEGGELNRDAGT